MATKVDPSDPTVRRAVYSMYRGILGSYNDKANNMVGAMPASRVVEDKGVSQLIQSMQNQSNQISGGGISAPIPSANGAPPPPPCVAGGIPSVRLPSEVGRREPPAAIQNAMMTKDKKPFTYTPGGLDLAEIRSPRMAKRISRNAHLEDSGDVGRGPVQSRSFRVLQKITGSDMPPSPAACQGAASPMSPVMTPMSPAMSPMSPAMSPMSPVMTPMTPMSPGSWYPDQSYSRPPQIYSYCGPGESEF